MNTKTINFLCWGFFDKLQHELIMSVKNQLSSLANFTTISKKYEYDDVDFDIFELIKCKINIDNYACCPSEWVCEFEVQHFKEFSLHYERYNYPFERFDVTNNEFLFNGQKLNAIKYYCDYFYTILQRHSIDLVLMFNPPHQGPDLVLKYIAQKLGIKILYLYQTLIPNAFICFEDLEQFGNYQNYISFAAPSSQTLKKGHEKTLFYMPKLDGSDRKVDKGLYLKFKLWAKKTIIGDIYFFVKPLLNFRSFATTIRKIYKDTKEDRSVIQSKKEYIRRSKAHKYLYKKEVKSYNITSSSKYIYFPLHYQPELTTSALGNVYVDQILAIEMLAEKLPSGWEIIIKENPKQGHYMRERDFFARIKRIANAIFVESSLCTYELMEGARLVATVSGTAGWESISGGKPVVVFGQAWYEKFPGVFKFNKSLDLEEVSQYKIDHDQLNDEYNQFISKCNLGIIAQPYRAMMQSFQDEENKKNFRCFIKQIIVNF